MTKIDCTKIIDLNRYDKFFLKKDQAIKQAYESNYIWVKS